MVGFVGFILGAKMEWEGCLGLHEGEWWLELFGEADEVIMRSSVEDSMRLSMHCIDTLNN